MIEREAAERCKEFAEFLDDAPPEQVSHEIVFHLMTPEGAIRIALSAVPHTPVSDADFERFLHR